MKISKISFFLIVFTAILATFFVCRAQFNKKITKRAEWKTGRYLEDISKITSEFMVEKLVAFDTYDENGPIELIRHGSLNDGGYVVPKIAFEKAEALLGYGIADDISFEEKFSDNYNKPSYGFDCGTESIEIKNPLCTFIRECIASDSFIQGNQQSSLKISRFPDQIKRLGLENKKIFLKMDIEGAEYDAFKEIYNNSSNITGIVLELHFGGLNQMLEASYLLSRLEKDFYLVHIHANNCEMNRFSTEYSKGEIPRVLEVTLINKNLVSKAEISKDQSYPRKGDSPNCPNLEDTKFEILTDKLPL